jgi:hypothetical protein
LNGSLEQIDGGWVQANRNTKEVNASTGLWQLLLTVSDFAMLEILLLLFHNVKGTYVI